MASTVHTGGYHRWSIRLHWAMVLLFVVVYAFIELRVLFDKGTDAREAMKAAHFMCGLLVLLLVWLRIALRLIYRVQPIVPLPPAWQRVASATMQGALYLMMIGMPLAGWATLSAYGNPVPFFGLELPAIVATDRALASQLQDWHVRIGDLGYWLIGLHAVAGLAHHYVRKDNALTRMLPAKAARTDPA
ncbi:cytochrome b [Luteimonas marina]|uniref:Cytochrome b n=1 Tax=Luteimonas marina TaxID=488485 RepID=A0A5C5U8M1_9GAMM|nr:cytochrome b [Luteimonas marina]TWT22309.1 cytochrome b [Luteimonas marina]